MTTFEVIDARANHCGQMARRLRHDYRQEFEQNGWNTHAELSQAFNASSLRRAWLIDGTLAGLGGVIGDLVSSDGSIWLALSEGACKHPRAVIREARRQIAEIMQTKTVLRAKVMPGDAAARRFALALGFRPCGEDALEYRNDWPEVSDPFVVFSLPRSRSRWLASFLSHGAECSHDLPVSVGSIDELCEALVRGGSVETGLTAAWRILRERFPKIRFAVVMRPVDQVKASAARFGWVFPDGYLEAQEAGLREIAALPGTVTVDHVDLGTESGARAIYEHCTGQPMDKAVWRSMDRENIQIDMRERMELLIANSQRMNALFKEIGQAVTVQEERFGPFHRDAQELFKAHYTEAGSFDGLPLDPNVEMALAMEAIGQLLVMTARVAGGIVGYLVYLINPSFESKGVLLGFQNIFYVKPAYRGRLGKRLRDAAIAALKARGVKMLILRSGVRARGPSLKAMFEREGARHMGNLYCLPLED